MAHVKRWQIAGATYHVTFSTRDRVPILKGRNADLVAEEVKRLGSERTAEIISWVVMPDHIHVLLKPQGGKLSRAINRLKGRTGLRLKAGGLELDRVWRRRYFDRRLRHESEIPSHAAYIEMNPVRAGLCARPEDWRWSSASHRASR